jgi:adenosine kinase
MYSQYLVFGSIAKDEIVFLPGNFEDFLDPSEPNKLNFSFLAEHITVQLGGIATNICYSLGQLVDKPVFVLGAVGDIDSDPFKKLFDSVGVRKDYLLLDENKVTGTYKALTAKNNNQIGGFYYGANELSKNILLKSILEIKNSLLIISANHPDAFYEIQKQAIDLKLDYLYDPGMTLSWISPEKLKEGCLNAKWLIVNDSEITQLEKITGLKTDDFVDAGVVVIVTKGGNGVELKNRNEEVNAGVVENIDVKDPTAAGDSFRAGFIAGLEKGFSVEDSLKCGASIASICLESNGGVEHNLDWDEVRNRMKLIK